MNTPSFVTENGVLLGEDGWLFLFGGSNEVAKLFSNPDAVLAGNIQRWRDLLEIRKAKVNLLGAQYFHLWVPDKFSVYSDMVPQEFALFRETPAQVITRNGANLESIIIDVLPDLLRAKSEHLLYWKTDTHWTYEGACIAYEVICRAFNTHPRRGLWTRPTHKSELALDLGGKLNPIIREKCHFANVLLNSKVSHKNEVVRFLEMLASKFQGEMHVGASVIFENRSPHRDPRKILIFGDSYCEYRPNSLSALIAETFQTVQFVWSASIDYGLIERFQPDIVLTEMAERFIVRLPQDDLDLSSTVYEKIANFLNANCRRGDEMKFHWTYK
jgi:hypothetical protein